jgi:octaprenyl-diphosphate synthase
MQAARSGNLDAVTAIANLGGTLSEGEIFQLNNIQSEAITEEAYFHIIERKTAALFTACGQLGAISANATPEYTTLATRVSTIIGMCFQIRDDIFDYFTDNIGKPTGNDLREGKFTLPAIYAINHHPDAHILELVKRVKNFEASAQDIQEIIDFAKAHGGIEYAQAKMQELRDEALDLLQKFRNQEVKDALVHYVNYVVDRNL